MSPDLCKIIVVGEKSTGKSSLINRYVTNSFQLKMRTTVGCDFSLKEHIQVDALPPITLQIWDISGQERFGQLTRVYYQMALGALVAYDVTNPESYEFAGQWKKDIDQKVRLPNGAPIPCLLVANKCDLKPTPPRNTEELSRFCKEFGFIGCVQTSSKEGVGVDRAFETLIRYLPNGASSPEGPPSQLSVNTCPSSTFSRPSD
eukprot:NODE_3945_length_869_cov_44.525606_g3790_i0.p1 GENE.NODE_3945_length_869_cov_44.525606_g3790_i0~~NODE_3945_length_869_cov_44.525606_g3790_i0.p1  ORF type:complete len:203 (-),score=40.32 NODE_3945_length_869_cov_44.525606_g3790_i0:182-790(-)